MPCVRVWNPSYTNGTFFPEVTVHFWVIPMPIPCICELAQDNPGGEGAFLLWGWKCWISIPYLTVWNPYYTDVTFFPEVPTYCLRAIPWWSSSTGAKSQRYVFPVEGLGICTILGFNLFKGNYAFAGHSCAMYCQSCVGVHSTGSDVCILYQPIICISGLGWGNPMGGVPSTREKHPIHLFLSPQLSHWLRPCPMLFFTDV